MSGQAGNNERPQEGKLTQEDPIRILRELALAKCFCGAKKVTQQTFCRAHYNALPGRLRSMLYQRFGAGYEEAYTEAREYFEKESVKIWALRLLGLKIEIYTLIQNRHLELIYGYFYRKR